jgi:hypothetical protein
VAPTTMGGDLMLAEDLTIEIRDRNLARIGQLPGTARWTITDMHLGVGTWEVQIPIEEPMSRILEQPGSGIIASDATGIVFSGRMTKIDYEATAADPVGNIKVSGVSDTILLADRLAYPDPEIADPLTQRTTVDIRTGPVEYLMHMLVSANIGPAAPEGRRIPNLTLGEDANRGPETTVRARFEPLLELLARLAPAAGLGFRIVQTDTAHLAFVTYQPSDLTGERWWSLEDNRLSGTRMSVDAPTLTRPIIGGTENDVETVYAAPTTQAATEQEALWGRRIERFIDGSADDAETTALTALDEEARTAVAAQPVPVDDDATGIGYEVGALVGIDAYGLELEATVTGYTMAADADGMRTEAAFGDAASVDFGRWLGRQSSAAAKRLAAIERGRPRIERRTDTATVNLPAGPSWVQLARLDADPAADFPDTTVTATLAEQSTTRLRLTPKGGIDLESHSSDFGALDAQTPTGLTDPARTGSTEGPFEVCYAPTDEGTVLLLHVERNDGSARDTRVRATIEHSTGGDAGRATWRPDIDTATEPTLTTGSIGLRSTETRTLKRLEGGDGTAILSGGYTFTAGPRVTWSGTINRPAIDGASDTEPVQSLIGYTGLGARPGDDLIWDLSDEHPRVLMLDTDGAVTLTAPAARPVAIALDGIAYTPTH